VLVMYGDGLHVGRWSLIQSCIAKWVTGIKPREYNMDCGLYQAEEVNIYSISI